MARQMVIDMTRAARVVSLYDALMGLAKDPSEELHFREAAVKAVNAIGDESTKGRFREVLAGDLSGDAYDELRGISLEALWPRAIASQ